ncbi:zinc finger BED domain-containing protein 4-like [Haliotis rubra]|uniref:zinc finger BED domain-containing protein 4-like n=1 Tax=Haliotis rubra TaxID=36100 RepID=UPI001EE5E460|nr:zinc finger BED domain-containing protein 4-like [Haliotis rubra]
MSTHLRRHHPDIDCNDYGQSKCSKPLNISDDKKRTSLPGQLRLSEAFKTKLSSRSTRAQAITNGIATFIAMDMRPYSLVENIGFKYLIHTLEPRYEIPSRTHYTNYVIPEMYKKVKSSVMESIARASSMAVTTDGWTSRSTESYITITAHYVNEDWQLENPVLQTRTLQESHTGANLANVLDSAVDEWNLGKFSQIAISTDNASNIVSAVKQSRFAPHIRCFAHTINIASQKAMQVPQMSRILGRVRRIVSFFHRSSHAASVLRSKQLLLELPDHKLIQDVSTRWNSSYDMLQRYLEQQAAIFATLTVKDIRKNADTLATLSEEDVSAVEDAVNVL